MKKKNTIAVESEEVKIKRRKGLKSVRTPPPKKIISADVTGLYSSLQTSDLIVLGKAITCKKIQNTKLIPSVLYSLWAKKRNLIKLL
jgi:hypothetical protein